MWSQEEEARGARRSPAQIMVSIRQYWDSPVVPPGLVSAPECWPPDLVWYCASPVNCVNCVYINSVGLLMMAVLLPCAEIAFGGEICGL